MLLAGMLCADPAVTSGRRERERQNQPGARDHGDPHYYSRSRMMMISASTTPLPKYT